MSICPIKAEYLLSTEDIETIEKVAESKGAEDNASEASEGNEKSRGQNKRRKVDDLGLRAGKEFMLCSFTRKGVPCPFGENCRYTHDLQEFLKSKPEDIGRGFLCLFDNVKYCPFGFACRFGSAHTDLSDPENPKQISHVPEGTEPPVWPVELNQFSNETRDALKRNRYEFKIAPQQKRKWQNKKRGQKGKEEAEEKAPTQEETKTTDPVQDVDMDASQEKVKLPAREKKKVDFKNKIYIAPLTTVGNLPFRRICKKYGADITCSEMALANELVKGNTSEWALLRRHPSEDVYGVQIAGAYPDVMARTAELIENELPDVDFVDINMGCPIDNVCHKGMGCGLMQRKKKIKTIVRDMTNILTIPLTVKMRMGINNNKPFAEALIADIRNWNCVAGIGLHGRSRAQRYTKYADWEYISRCADVCHRPMKRAEGADIPPVDFFGNGDVLNYTDWTDHLSNHGVDTCLVGRGALIKPWISTEIKEQRYWDISSSERFDMLKEFVNFGLEHWGSDQRGVNTTRRFLLEWQSFLCRYVPVGLLEKLPQRLNDKPPAYIGRNDLETLMGSRATSDWVRLSEMLLGPVPPDFRFVPKHRANSYAVAVGNTIPSSATPAAEATG